MSTQPAALSMADFLAWEARQEAKHEFVDGRAVAFAGGTIDHASIAANLIAALNPPLRNRPCLVLGSDAMVETTRTLRYPDVVVTCDPRDRGDARTLRFPLLIVEVMSDSSALTDRGDKLEEYTSLPSLAEYVLVDSRRRWAQVFRRRDSAWLMEPPITSGALRLECIEMSLDIEETYTGTAVA